MTTIEFNSFKNDEINDFLYDNKSSMIYKNIFFIIWNNDFKRYEYQTKNLYYLKKDMSFKNNKQMVIEKFTKWLDKFINHQYELLPRDLLNDIKNISKNIDQITAEDIRLYLKETKNNKYYKNIPNIYNILKQNSDKFEINDKLKKKIIDLYKLSYDKLGITFNYRFFLSKCLLLFDKKELHDSIPVLKSDEKRYSQTNDWLFFISLHINNDKEYNINEYDNK